MRDARHDTLQARIAALEARSRLLARCLLGVLAAATLLALAPAQDGGLRARRIELVDAEGRVRAELAIDAEGSAGLFVRDDEGRLRASVTHDEQQSALFLRDEAGAIRVGAAQFAHGGGGFAAHGPENKGAAVLYLKESGSLTFLDAAGAVTARIPD